MIIDLNERMKEKRENVIFQFRIDIEDAHPPIWRRILFEVNTTFAEVHEILQAVFYWENYHLHQFMIDRNTCIADITNEFHEPYFQVELDEKKTTLAEIFRGVGDKVVYEYDFGDSWRHIIKLEKILEKKSYATYPSLIKGRKMAPKEDIGGIHRWNYICEVMRNPDHVDRKEIIDMYGVFNPDKMFNK
ncbi:MAG: plasmid pRiA4b ORF-3 family protein [Candidatus Cloacimonadota bacterium]|nr:plasmid pRiA4b ORF-3 family protein [Candidatus Cloacimonadota bacterium]